MGELLQRYDEILTEAVGFHEAQPPLQTVSDAVKRRGRPKRRTGHNLALRLQKRKAEVIRLLNNHKVPFTNNEAERDLRKGKVSQKVSGRFRVVRGRDFLQLAHCDMLRSQAGLVCHRNPDETARSVDRRNAPRLNIELCQQRSHTCWAVTSNQQMQLADRSCSPEHPLTGPKDWVRPLLR